MFGLREATIVHPQEEQRDLGNIGVLTRPPKLLSLKTVGQAQQPLFHCEKMVHSKIIAKERELGIPDGRGVSKLFALAPFAEIKRFLARQANDEARVRMDGWVGG